MYGIGIYHIVISKSVCVLDVKYVEITKVTTLWNTPGLSCQKLYFLTYAPSEDSDQPAHSRSLIWILTWRISDSQGCKAFDEDNKDSNQTVRMRILIWGFVERMSAGTFSDFTVHNGLSLQMAQVRCSSEQ